LRSWNLSREQRGSDESAGEHTLYLATLFLKSKQACGETEYYRHDSHISENSSNAKSAPISFPRFNQREWNALQPCSSHLLAMSFAPLPYRSAGAGTPSPGFEEAVRCK